MFTNFEEVQKYSKEQVDAATATFASWANGVREIATESTDYSKKSLETSSAYVEKLLTAKSFDTALQVQSEYATTIYKGLVAHATKFSELYTSLAKDMLKRTPIEAPTFKMPVVSATPDEAPVAKTPAAAPASVAPATSRQMEPPVAPRPQARATAPVEVVVAGMQTDGASKRPTLD